jgi:hypothetical protein
VTNEGNYTMRICTITIWVRHVERIEIINGYKIRVRKRSPGRLSADGKIIL